MRTGKDRVEVAAVGEPVAIGGVQVRVGDLLLGDQDGVLVIARESEEEVLTIALEIAGREEKILAKALAGATIAEARAEFGYHRLQRRAAQ
jgi:regulator of RNase E activity RraA